MTTIPATAREFERWYADNNPNWPEELQDAGLRALLTLKSLDQPNVQKSEVFMRESAKDLMAFAEAFGAWRATQ